MPTNVLVLNKSWLVTGAGTPEGTQAGPVGSLYLREDGATGTSLYVKEAGTGNTGWTPFTPARNSGVFGYTFSTQTTEPPANQTIRLNAGHPYTAVTKAWVSFQNSNSEDLYFGWLAVATGSVLLVQDKDNHAQYAEFTTTGPPVEKGTYVELPVAWRRNGTALANQACLVRTTSPTLPVTLGQWQDVPFSAANFSAAGGGTWTVGAAAVIQNRYTLIGKTAIWAIYVSWFSGSNTLAGTVTGLNVTLPGVEFATAIYHPVAYAIDGGALADLMAQPIGGGVVQLTKKNGANFTAGAPGFVTSFTLEIH